ncbi:MAG TPA: rRNA maturation RNase YbeY [Lachnoclostridium phytofermentans]|uniref:Endoribonuclease YbeY n=1 Tax=Lachnoclostridium phytofermentans TaxID=66219 RepID=A0A3D2X9A8_9FIRM|nr:rRNA maturation RNase YbeY [Lachnoclostridium sp.]HCL03701.1 rRNA maturation RNase YbeY [Lachnoclostridium phytofermentans]
MTIHIEKETELNFDFNEEILIKEVIEAALDYEECPYETEINVVLTNNEEIKEINKEYREIDAPTDVLSFPMVEFGEPSDFDHVEEEQEDCFHPDSGELMLGDIIVSVDKVISQAKEFGHSEKRELGFLIAHSMLHLCGYDHMEEEEREIMEERQRAILDRIHLSR